MNAQRPVIIFGEVLFDCFDTGEQILGGAPFNVAWHLQALGNHPKFISRVGNDKQGHSIKQAMMDWGMDVSHIQTDQQHQTGRVEVTVIDNEPHYDIVSNVAYDFIDVIDTQNLSNNGIIYHGSLALRQKLSQSSFEQLVHDVDAPIFVDINLRQPWWNQAKIESCLRRARWVKLNEQELGLIGFRDFDIELAMKQLQHQFQLDQLIVTRGEHGVFVLDNAQNLHHAESPKVQTFVDAVGAGDAFTARYIHGLLANENIEDTIAASQKFAVNIIGLRGAISNDVDFYKDFIS